jgi:hypothetical protein
MRSISFWRDVRRASILRCASRNEGWGDGYSERNSADRDRVFRRTADRVAMLVGDSTRPDSNIF